MKKNMAFIVTLLFCFATFTSCKKDYIVGGEKEDINTYKGMTTMEALKTFPQFDTLLQLIDAAGIADLVNASNSTFFAPVNASISAYLNQRTNEVQEQYNVDAQFGIDSLKYYIKNNINGSKDSLKMYVINHLLTYDSLSSSGTIYNTALQGSSARVSYEPTQDGSLGFSSTVSTWPKIVFYTFLWYPDQLNEIDVKTLVTESGILTKNGVIHVLEPAHMLFFYETSN